jgi:hypothetical protein
MNDFWYSKHSNQNWIAYDGRQALWEAENVKALKKGLTDLGYDFAKFVYRPMTILVIK